jgi:agmatine/peptidylarginine deiminase
VIICNNSNELKKYFNDFKNIEIFEAQTDDTWIRDFGAIDFYEDEKLKSYNFKFNAWGDKFNATLDNDFNKKFFKNNLIDIDFILEGGSIDSNGKGVLLTTAKCIYNPNRNFALTKDEINQKIKKLFGLKELIVLENGALVGDDTDSHIDTLARFIDEDTIAYVKCYDKEDEHYHELQRMEKELEKTDFKLLPLPLPKAHFFEGQRLPATYLNFVFINDALIVPTYNDESDFIVIDTLKKYLDTNVLAVDASILIREHGSLHCASINQMLQK